ncbi:MAG TPA: hypothetical protein VIN04_03985 [Myxococcota bacterium]
MRRLLVVLALLVLVAAGALVWFVRFSLDGRVKRAIETRGSALTLSPVRVEGVDIDLAGGRGTIRGITVGNPEGFPSGPALSLAGIEIAIDVGSLAGDPLVIREIRVGEPRVHVILDAQGRMNLDVLRRNVRDHPERVAAAERAAGREGAPPARREAPAAEQPGAERRVRVGELTIEEGRIVLDASALGREPQELPLGSVELREVGGARGATPEQLGRRVADALIARTARAVAGAELERTLREKGGELGGKLGELLRRGIDR